jgi:hypothetical protein
LSYKICSTAITLPLAPLALLALRVLRVLQVLQVLRVLQALQALQVLQALVPVPVQEPLLLRALLVSFLVRTDSQPRQTKMQLTSAPKE